jgi:hypothetical protein
MPKSKNYWFFVIYYFIDFIAANAIAIDTLSEQIIARGDIYERFNDYDIAQIVNWM